MMERRKFLTMLGVAPFAAKAYMALPAPIKKIIPGAWVEVIVKAGVITSIVITNGGSGYTNPHSITFTEPKE